MDHSIWRICLGCRFWRWLPLQTNSSDMLRLSFLFHFRLDFHLVQLFFVCMPSLGLFHEKSPFSIRCMICMLECQLWFFLGVLSYAFVLLCSCLFSGTICTEGDQKDGGGNILWPVMNSYKWNKVTELEQIWSLTTKCRIMNYLYHRL